MFYWHLHVESKITVIKCFDFWFSIGEGGIKTFFEVTREKITYNIIKIIRESEQLSAIVDKRNNYTIEALQL